MQIQIIALLALGLLIFGCAGASVSLPKTFPLFDCDSMQKTIEKSCDVQLTKMNWSGNSFCGFASNDQKFEYYFNGRPIEPYYNSTADLKKVLDGEKNTYEELDLKDGAVYLNATPSSSNPTREFRLYIFYGNYDYSISTYSHPGPADDSHCVSKAGDLRLVELLGSELFTNKTVTYAEQMPHR